MTPTIPEKREPPRPIRPYLFHGVGLNWESGADQLLSDCPFCGREEKFSINVETGQWRCFACGIGEDGKDGGNAYTFLRLLWKQSYAEESEYAGLVKDRGVSEGTLRAWGVCQSILTDYWIVPGYNAKGNIIQLYRWATVWEKRTGLRRKTLLATPWASRLEYSHGLFRPVDYDDSNPSVYLCEGAWDGMKFWEVAGRNDLLKSSSVLAVPGCSTFAESWVPLFGGKEVFVLYDNDYLREDEKTGREIPSAALEGTKRVAGFIGEAAASVSYLRWGEKGWTEGLPHGYDVRDLLNA